MTALAAFAVLVWRTIPGATVGVPVTAPLIFERLAKKLGGHVRRTRATPDALMTTGAVTEPPDFLGDGQGGYIFPEFHPGFDAMMASVRLLQCLTQEGVSLSEVIAALPPFHMGHVEVRKSVGIEGEGDACPSISGPASKIATVRSRRLTVYGLTWTINGAWCSRDPDRAAVPNLYRGVVVTASERTGRRICRTGTPVSVMVGTELFVSKPMISSRIARAWHRIRRWSVWFLQGRYLLLARLLGMYPEPGAAGKRGTVFIEIDGLGHDHLRSALRQGYLPFLRDLLDRDLYRRYRWRCGLVADTPAAQSGLLYGTTDGIVGFYLV